MLVPEDGTVTLTISCAASDLAMWDLEVGGYMVTGGNYSLKVAQYSSDPQAQGAMIAVTPSPVPAPEQNMRARATRYAAEH